MADAPASSGGPRNLADAYASLGLPTDKRPGHVINRRHGQTMVHLGLLDASFNVRPLAFWSDGSRIKVLTSGGEFRPEVAPSTELHLPPGAAAVFDAFVEIARNSLERVEDVDRSLAELEKDPLHAPPLQVMELKRKVADIREELGRAVTAVADVSERRVLSLPEGSGLHLRSLEQEFLRLREMTSSTQLSLSDLFLIRQTEQANQLQLMTNRMSAVANRVAELANISNIRMLGLSFVMLILAVMTSVIVFPNTAATILGMPTAAWVPGWLVSYVLIVSTVIPLYYFFRQKWIRDLFTSMGRYEVRVGEGLGGLPEKVAGIDDDYAEAAKLPRGLVPRDDRPPKAREAQK